MFAINSFAEVDIHFFQNINML